MTLTIAPFTARWLESLLLGASSSRAIGVNVIGARLILLLLTAVAASASTLIVGPLSFVGLMTPYGSDAGLQRPLSHLFGAAILGSLTRLRPIGSAGISFFLGKCRRVCWRHSSVRLTFSFSCGGRPHEQYRKTDRCGPSLARGFHLLRPFWPLVAFATAIGILSGLATAWLLATINAGLHEGGVTWPLLARFAGLCLLSVGGTAIAGVGNSMVGQKIIANLRKDISARILRAPIAALEAHHSYRLIAVLTGDVDTISAFTFNFSGYAIALAITIGSFVYLFTLSPIVFLLAIVSLAAGVVINTISRRRWIRDYEDVRVAQDELHKQYRAITDGAKELKISRPRRGRVHGLLLSGAADRIASLKSRAMRLHWLADAGGSAVFFLVIGLLLAGQSHLGIDVTVITGAAIVLLYVKGPVAQISGALPVFDQARISFTRIATLSTELDQHEPNISIAGPRMPIRSCPRFVDRTSGRHVRLSRDGRCRSLRARADRPDDPWRRASVHRR